MATEIAPPRALIIAIEKYPQSIGMATTLKGTNDAGNEFWKWFVKKVESVSTEENKLNPKDLVLGCVDEPYEWRTAGTTRADILAQIKALKTKGKENTSELYFFFSGHGISYSDMGWTRAIDVLVASDFTVMEESGGACIKLQEIQEKLWTAMGPGHHYYFIDACRNNATHADINVTDTGLILGSSEIGKPFRYTLYSTVKGVAAKTESGFSNALVAGLTGSGRAKGWENENSEMWVKFDLLVDYVEAKLPKQAVDPNTDGNGDGLILELRPPFERECKIKIDNASPTDKFKVVARTNVGQNGPHEFQGDSFTLSLMPSFYNLELTHPAMQVIQIEPPPAKKLDLYDPCEVKFQLAAPGLAVMPPAPAPPVTSTFEVIAPPIPEAEIELTDMLSGGGTMRGVDLPLTRSASPRRRRSGGAKPKEPSLQGELQPGTYRLKMRERGVVVGSRKVTVEAGEKVKIDLLDRPQSKTREDLLRAIANDPKAKVVTFSDLGPTANMDLSLWLSLFGAGRILGSEVKKELAKFEELDLVSFDDLAAGESCVYLLTAFEKSKGQFAAGLSKGKDVHGELLQAVPNLTSVYQWRQKAAPGPYLLTLQLPQQVPVTFATYCLPNRVTFMVVAEDSMGRLDVRLYMLPVGKLLNNLDWQVRERIQHSPLNIVRYMSLVQNQFARKRSLEPAAGTDEAMTWSELVHGKWVDPVMSLIAAYFFIRNGKAARKASASDKSLLNEVAKNLRRYFGDLPDIAAIEKAMGQPTETPKAAPLILDGALLLGEDAARVLPLPQEQLDYNGPWTSWRGAVNTSAPGK